MFTLYMSLCFAGHHGHVLPIAHEYCGLRHQVCLCFAVIQCCLSLVCQGFVIVFCRVLRFCFWFCFCVLTGFVVSVLRLCFDFCVCVCVLAFAFVF